MRPNQVSQLNHRKFSIHSMTGSQLRKKYLDFFQSKGHKVIPSASLVPENDATTLFTSSGMQPLVPYLLGEKHPLGTRLTGSQKSFRSQDIEEVGDNRHTTFFEMLGNWSLGDYFKKDQLKWIFQFLTEEVGLDPKRLYVTVFAGEEKFSLTKDTESVKIWQELFSSVGIEAEVVEDPEKEGLGKAGRIFYYPAKKNWWSRAGEPEKMPPGEPGGPDSEVFYDFGPELKLHENSSWKDQPCHVNCDCGRFMEIGNSVFMQYLKTEDGFKPLPKKNVDFGGGLERILAASMDQPDVFLTDLLKPIIDQLISLTKKDYQGEDKMAMRVIADHLRASVMLIADGVMPGNKEREYFVRRLLRRAIRFGHQLGIDRPFLDQLVPVVVDIYKDHYTDLLDKQEQIEVAVLEEEKKFRKALAYGLKKIDSLPKLDAYIAFKLYESYGFPFELTEEIAKERGETIDKREFEKLKKAHADKSRTASAGKFKGGLVDKNETTTKFHTATHLLHAALRQVLGEKVRQRGSHITTERLRFDFEFDRALTPDEISQVETLVNDWIKADLPVHRQVLPKEEALKSGAVAFFGEKYPDMVSVYTIGNSVNDYVSKEFCGGPHVKHTGEIGGPLKIKKEKSSGAGVRRIYMGYESVKS